MASRDLMVLVLKTCASLACAMVQGLSVLALTIFIPFDEAGGAQRFGPRIACWLVLLAGFGVQWAIWRRRTRA